MDYRKESELEPEPQFVISAPAPGGNLISALGSGSATLVPSQLTHLSRVSCCPLASMTRLPSSLMNPSLSTHSCSLLQDKIKSIPGHRKAMLRIHEILVRIRMRIRIRRSPIPLTNGSGILLFSSVIFKTPKKILLLITFSRYIPGIHHFSKIKSHSEVTKQLESMFFLLFLLDDRRIRISISDQWIRMWIREAQNTATMLPGM
jgi:hypothetical protein